LILVQLCLLPVMVQSSDKNDVILLTVKVRRAS
jgi:hypothetical protein